MTTFIALLRAINVSGTGLLPMRELTEMCIELDLGAARTYIQSGNVVFASKLGERAIQAKLERILFVRMGKKIDVFIRSAAELRGVLEANPFREQPPAKVAVFFLSAPIEKTWIKDVVAPGSEQVQIGNREIYIYYPDGMGRSKLKLPPLTGPTTARNLNTVSQLVSMATA
jgi:uncharacterized protein (DUF1697 family)